MSDSPHQPGGECRSCPVCLALQVMGDVRPEVAEHLAAAGRELVLALRAALAPTREDGGGWASPSREATDTVHDRTHDHATATRDVGAGQCPPDGLHARPRAGAADAARAARAAVPTADDARDARAADGIGTVATGGTSAQRAAVPPGATRAPRHLRRIDITGTSSR